MTNCKALLFICPTPYSWLGYLCLWSFAYSVLVKLGLVLSLATELLIISEISVQIMRLAEIRNNMQPWQGDIFWLQICFLMIDKKSELIAQDRTRRETRTSPGLGIMFSRAMWTEKKMLSGGSFFIYFGKEGDSKNLPFMGAAKNCLQNYFVIQCDLI